MLGSEPGCALWQGTLHELCNVDKCNRKAALICKLDIFASQPDWGQVLKCRLPCPFEAVLGLHVMLAPRCAGLASGQKEAGPASG